MLFFSGMGSSAGTVSAGSPLPEHNTQREVSVLVRLIKLPEKLWVYLWQIRLRSAEISLPQETTKPRSVNSCFFRKLEKPYPLSCLTFPSLALSLKVTNLPVPANTPTLCMYAGQNEPLSYYLTSYLCRNRQLLLSWQPACGKTRMELNVRAKNYREQ